MPIQSDTRTLIGILGGTFDPIHNGHLFMAWHAKEKLLLNQVRFTVSHISAHGKSPIASAHQRLKMVKLATINQEDFIADDIEFNITGPSYSLLTLRKLNQYFNQSNQQPGSTEPKPVSLCLIIGIDSFLTFNKWYYYEEILKECHLLVVNRPNYRPEYNTSIKKLLSQHHSKDSTALQKKQNGVIYFLDNPSVDLSSTAIRKMFADGQTPKYLMPENSLQYAIEQNIYFPTPSSKESL